MVQIKICGLTDEKEAEYLNEAEVDFAGFVQFFPKSKRNIPLEKAVLIKKELSPSIKSVAVTVSPTLPQLQEIEAAGFHYVQIHGNLEENILNQIHIPIMKAFNVNDLALFPRYARFPQVQGFVFDAQIPGSGCTFDWSLVPSIPKSNQFSLLAGGLNPGNVAKAILATGATGVDTSSGVENDSGLGKSREKILEFVKAVREI